MTVQEAMDAITVLTGGNLKGVYLTNQYVQRINAVVVNEDNLYLKADEGWNNGEKIERLMPLLESFSDYQIMDASTKKEVRRFFYECVVDPTIVFEI